MLQRGANRSAVDRTQCVSSSRSGKIGYPHKELKNGEFMGGVYRHRALRDFWKLIEASLR
jgi:hypothetical protein